MSWSGVDIQSTATRDQVSKERRTDFDGERAGDGWATPAAALRACALIFLASLTVMTYHLLFQFTKPSPLSTGAWLDLLPVASYAVLVALTITVVGLPVAFLVDVLSCTLLGRRQAGVGTVVVTAGMYFLGLLAFLENFLYTLEGVGLKTDNSVLLKVAFGVLAVSAGTLLARQTAKMSARGVRRMLLLMPVLCVPAVVVVIHYLASEEAPQPLVAAAEPNLLNVVILSSDGIDAERMSVYGYSRETTPFLDSKASEFRVFENAFTNNGNTTGSITSLLTGSSPLSTGVVYPPDTLNEDHAMRSLPYLLGKAGYYRSNWAVPHYADGHDQNLVGAFDVDNGYREADSLVARLPLGSGPARWFVLETLEGSEDLVLDVVGAKEMENPYSQVATVVGDTLSDDGRMASVKDEIRTKSRFFVNTHFMVTHGPSFRVKEPLFSRGEQQATAWERDFYDDAIRQFDSNVEGVYDQLLQAGKLDRTLLIVTSDHGMDYDATKRIPLMIRFPRGDLAGRFSVNVQRLDVAPTVLDALGFAPPTWMHGKSLVRTQDIPPDRQITAANTATRIFPNHYGFRPRHGDLLLTAIRCDSYVRRQPSGELERGRVSGSTARCQAAPDSPSEPGP